MIELIFAAFIAVITFFVTGIIIVGILLLPLIFKGGWVIYLIMVLMVIASWFDEKRGEK